MDLIEAIGFQELGPAELAAYARQKASQIELIVPEAYVPNILDTLAALQTHAAILSAALEDREPPATRTQPP